MSNGALAATASDVLTPTMGFALPSDDIRFEPMQVSGIPVELEALVAAAVVALAVAVALVAVSAPSAVAAELPPFPVLLEVAFPLQPAEKRTTESTPQDPSEGLMNEV
jgi:hypothetical protein